MQYEQYQPGNGDYNIPQLPADKRSQAMMTAAIILSVIAISTICCFYLSFVCGALAMTFALLSKGGELTMSQNAKTALYIGAAAMVLTVVLTILSFVTVILRYGSLDAFLKAYAELLNAYSAGLE